MNTINIWKRKKTTLIVLSAVILFGILANLTGCAGNKADAASDVNTDVPDKKWKVIATTTMLADLAGNIAGNKAEITGLMGPGIDPHLYQASAGDVVNMQEADVVVYNGLHLEGKMGDIFENLESRQKHVFCIEDGIADFQLLAVEENTSAVDPHVWFDVSIWKAAASYLADSFAAIDPESESYYKENLESYLQELDELDRYINARIQELPSRQRVLVTAHDAFQYFGNAYGVKVKGIQGISTDAEAGTADVSSLADFIAEQQIRAVFIESSVPPKAVKALQEAVAAKGFQTRIGGELYSDSLGDEGSGHDSYIATFRANVDTIVDALK